MSNKFMEAFIPEEVLIVWYQDALIDYYDDIFKLTFDQELADCKLVGWSVVASESATFACRRAAFVSFRRRSSTKKSPSLGAK
ncbi:unnamed protein product [Rotaria magnacalcarata]|uniref:Uncharacterized protein n=2 Tax=Rotaria magnacalcarata TaxID=392030 RepID=A0A816MY70_9BILA|nr:unnamed protein product [Rotaria magnacalcarata]